MAEKIFNKTSKDGALPAKTIVIDVDKKQRDALWDNTLNLSSSMVQLAPRLKSDKKVPMRLYTAFAVCNHLGHGQACAQTAKTVSANEQHTGEHVVTANQVQESKVRIASIRQKNRAFADRLKQQTKQQTKEQKFTSLFAAKYNKIRNRDCLSGVKSYNLNASDPKLTASDIFKHAAGLHEGSSGKRTKKLLLSSVADVVVRRKVSEQLGIIKRNNRIESSDVYALVNLLSQPMGAHRSGMFAHNEKTCATEALLDSAHNPSPYRVEIR